MAWGVIMKTLILTLFVLTIFVNLQSQTLIDYQNYSRKDAIIGASILGATFITLEIKGNQMTYGQRSITAMSGIAISAGYSLIVTTKPYKALKHRIKMNRNKSINRNEILICEK